MIIRDATETDLPALRDIFNDAVLNTTAIWMDNVVGRLNDAARALFSWNPQDRHS